jgi:hypothetical protein
MGEHVDRSLATSDIYAATLRIVEQIIRIAAGIEHLDSLAVLLAKHGQPGRDAKDGQNLPRIIQGQWKIGEQQVCFPGRDLLAGGAIDYRNLPGARQVYENPRPVGIESEAFRVRGQGYVSHFPLRPGINGRQGATSIPDPHPVGCFLNPNIVGIIAQLDGAKGSQIRALVHPHRSIFPIRDIYRVRRGLVANALWLLQPAKGLHDLASLQINYTNSVVTQLGNIQPVAPWIDGQVIDAAPDVPQCNS